jgi:hypothetical protein
MRQRIRNILLETSEYSRKEYLTWKRKNVTLRGIKNLGEHNSGFASYGTGLYTAALSNKSMAKEYGTVYFLVNARPKHPKVVQSVNEAEIFLQQLIKQYCKDRGRERYDTGFFYSETSIKDEMLRLGYDGLEIKGREMVNYTPDEDSILYFQTERQLEDYYRAKCDIDED